MSILSTNIFKFNRINSKLNYFRNKYVVLLPEIPPDTPENNPLLRHNSLPPFSELTSEKCVNAIGKLLIEYESGIHHLDDKLQDPELPKTIQNIILPLDRLSGPLDFAWGVFKMLYTVRNNESIANAYVKLHTRIIKAKRERYMSTSLYKSFKELKSNENDLTVPTQRLVNKHILEARLSGMDTSGNSARHFQTIMQKLDEEKGKYRRNLMMSTNSFQHNLEFNDVKSMPRELIQLLSSNPSNISRGPWVLTLEPHVYHSFLEHCDVRMLRWNAWSAYHMRASSVSAQQLNNSLSLEEIRYQRLELAKLLGYKTYAELSMETKMAGNVQNAIEMITTLHVKSKSTTLLEIEELQEFATKRGFQHKLEIWDIPYWQRLHKEELFNIDEDVVRQYFPLPVVLEGVFSLCQKLFNIRIVEVREDIDVWHDDVKLYKILDANDEEIASFFMDPYHRGTDKAPGSWLEIGRNHSDVTGSDPLSYLIFNFHTPSFGKPSLLSFEDLKLLFKKFGHLLQHSLTTIPYSDVAGLTYLEWDVVNVCPLVMSHFLSQHSIVASLSQHVESGSRIPADLHTRLIKRDKYMKGLYLTEELYRSALDLELYSSTEFWVTLMKNLWQQYIPFPFEKNYALPCSFPEIVCDQFPAAYFSSLWAEMIAADVFTAFEEAGFDNDETLKKIGMRFRNTFLSLGGGCFPGEVFRKFRGRDPSTDALLVALGLATQSSAKRDQ